MQLYLLIALSLVAFLAPAFAGHEAVQVNAVDSWMCRIASSEKDM
jgi:hypothetical protein